MSEQSAPQDPPRPDGDAEALPGPPRGEGPPGGEGPAVSLDKDAVPEAPGGGAWGGAGNPFAAPGPGDPLPPPPTAPGGPGPYGPPGQPGPGMPYGYPGGPGGPNQPYYPYAPPYPGPYGAPGYGWGTPPQGSNGLGVAGLALGITAAAGFCLWPFAIVLGILAIVFGAIGRGKAVRGEATNPGQALAGIICGSVGLLFGTLMLVLFIVRVT
ncbi:DUF4190 domain-containing protein [Streptomyces sp. NPDC058045]|uniref:DUF4190 domain-containing protein n=1 Tax=Streptomyces sp. NPDC058045 TaxID=3346311 RepID=UPI0036EC8CAF